jgi:hypothetical protein
VSFASPVAVYEIVRGPGTANMVDPPHNILAIEARTRFGLKEPAEPPTVLIEHTLDDGQTWETLLDLGPIDRKATGTRTRSPEETWGPMRLRWELATPERTLYYWLWIAEGE